nr:CgiF [Flavobacterium sp.]
MRLYFRKLWLTNLFLGGALASSAAIKASDFYTDKIKEAKKTVNLVKDYKVNNKDDQDDSKNLQKAIDDLTAIKKGGVINIPEGKYYFKNIILKSNVHIVIDEKATIYATYPGSDKNFMIMSFGDESHRAKNVSVRAKKGMYTVDLSVSKNKNVRMFQVNNSENFLIEGMNILDDNTKFNGITLGYCKYNGKYVMPENGVIKNCRIEKAHYGYGLIQSQASTNVYYENIWGDGGVTLRLETDNLKMNDLQVGGNHNIHGKNIYCQNGNAALMISPHSMQNGHVEMDGVESVNCGFAVRIGKGYVSKKQKVANLKPGTYANQAVESKLGRGCAQTPYARGNGGTRWAARVTQKDACLDKAKLEYGIEPGSFGTVKVSNIKSTYGTTAQVKSKHFKYMPCPERKLIRVCLPTKDGKNPDGESFKAPSCVTVVNTKRINFPVNAKGKGGAPKGYWNVEITNVESVGYPHQSKDILYEQDAVKNCKEGK